MILIDTSAWVEYLRDTGSVVCTRVEDLLAEQQATCHPVRMELLAGARDEHHLQQLRGLLGRTSVVPTSPGNYEDAAGLYRTCRRNGETIRKLIDCLIATHAIRRDIPLLHADTDFEALARHSSLIIDRP